MPAETEKSFPYGSQNHDRRYKSEDFRAYYKQIIGNGVIYANADALKVSEGGGMVIKLNTGGAFIEGVGYRNTSPISFTLSTADGALSRIDRLVIRNDYTIRKTYAAVLKGTYSQQPQPQSITRNADCYEIAIADIYVGRGVVSITQANITDLRLNKQLCGIVTGLIHQADTTEIYNQFETYLNSFKEQHTSEFNLWKEARKTEFFNWVETIKDILDTNAAGHLQNQIGNLPQLKTTDKSSLVNAINEVADTGICLIRVDCEEFFKGKSVTATNGTESYTVTVPNAAPYNLLFKVKDVGTWSISHGEYSTSVSVPYFGVYSTTLSQGDIKITVNYDTEFEGKVISAKNGTTIRTKTAAGGLVSFMVNDEGVWEISAEIDGKSRKINIIVQHGHEYTVRLSKVGSYEEWLSAGGISTGFSSLDEVLADEKTIRQLITKHTSCDYLAEWLSNDTEDVARQILNNDLVAKWINLRDYCIDKLYSYPAVKSVMDGLKKYGYGEWGLVSQIPLMTSNILPQGKASASTIYNSAHSAFNAFNDNDNTYWFPSHNDAKPWLQYEFDTSKVIKSVYLYGSSEAEKTIKYTFKGSNDGNVWTDIESFFFVFSTKAVGKTFDVSSNEKSYKYYRLEVADGIMHVVNVYSCKLIHFKMYAYALKGSVPVMTGNAAPYGLATSTGIYGGYNPYVVFDGKDKNISFFADTANPSVGYNFVDPMCLKRVWIKNCSDGPNKHHNNYIKSFKLQASNDGSQWVELGTFTTKSNEPLSEDVFDIDNENYYLQYRLVKSGNAWGNTVNVSLGRLQFYGRELRVSVPVMISNSSPWGEIIFNASDFQPTAYPPLNCFKGSMTNGTIANNGSAWLGYDFKNPIVINGFKFHGRDNGYKGFSENAKIQGTNDLSQWNDVALNIGNSSFGTDVFKFFENKTAYRYWRVIDNAPYRWGVYSINFYGLDCLENEKRHWIYDHGVEFIPLNVSGNSALATLDTTQYNLLRATDVGHANTGDTLKCGTASAVVNGLPYNNYLDISNANGSNEAGFGNRNMMYLDETSLWLE